MSAKHSPKTTACPNPRTAVGKVPGVPKATIESNLKLPPLTLFVGARIPAALAAQLSSAAAGPGLWVRLRRRWAGVVARRAPAGSNNCPASRQ